MSKTEIDCPRARTAMTPCIARDGHLALLDPPKPACVGCGQEPYALLKGLSERYPPAGERLGSRSPDANADSLAEMVRAYVGTKE